MSRRSSISIPLVTLAAQLVLVAPALAQQSPAPTPPPAPPTQPPAQPTQPPAQPTQPLPAPPEAPTTPAPDEPPLDLESYQGLDLEELLSVPVAVWSATKTESRIVDAPAMVTVISGEDMRRWGYRSVAEVLQHMVGFYVIDDHILANVAVRGVSGGLHSESGLVKVMIDGQTASFRSTAGNWLGPALLPLSVVERIEIVRGPSSALYGADAFQGVINITTRAPHRLSGADVSVTGVRPSSSGKWGGGPDAAIGGRRGPVELLLSYRSHDVDLSGMVLPATSPAPVIPDYRFDNRVTTGMQLGAQVGFGKLIYHFSRTTRAVLSGWFSRIDRVAELSPTTQLSHGLDVEGRHNETRVALHQESAGLKIESAFHPDLQLTVDLTYYQGGPTANDRVEVGSNLFWVRRKFGFRGTDSTAQLAWRISPRLSVLGGVGFIFDRERLPATERVLKGRVGALEAGTAISDEPTRSRSFVNPGVYLQAIYAPIERYLQLTGGLRVDRHNIYGNQLSTRAAVVSEVLRGTFVKLLYGSSFKAPSPFLLYATPAYVGGIIGNPGLKPQYINTVESHVSHQRPHVTVSTGLVYNIVQDKAEFAQQGLNQVARNVSSSRVLSWETALEFRYQDRLGGYLRGELTRVRRNPGREGYVDDLIGTAGVIYPQHVARAGAIAQLPRLPLRATIEALHVGERRASDTNILERGASYTLPSYWMLGGTLATTGLRFLELNETTLMFTVRNLLRARGPDPGFAGIDYPLAPRTFLFEARQRL